MSKIAPIELTKLGGELLSISHGDVELKLLNAVIGSGAWTDEECSAKNPPAALKAVEHTTPIIGAVNIGKGASTVEFVVTNTGLKSGYHMTEFGITANHPEHGEILYMAGYIPLEQADFMHPDGRMRIEDHIFVDIKHAPGGKVTFTINDSAVFATRTDVATMQNEHNVDPVAHPAMYAPVPVLSLPAGASATINEGESIALTIAGLNLEKSPWSMELHVRVLAEDGTDATEEWKQQITGDVLTLTAPHVTGDKDFTVEMQAWRHGSLASPWCTPVTLTVVDVPVDPPTLLFPANHAVNIGETPTLRWTKGASDDPSKQYTGAEIIISRDLLRTVVVEQIELGAVTEWTVPSDVLHTNEHLYASVRTKWGDSWSGYVTHDFFTSAQFQFIQAPTIIAPQQSSEVMWSGLKVVIATPTVEQGGTLQQDKIECEYKKGSEAVKTIRVDKAQLFVDLPTLEMDADHSARVRVHDKVRGWSGWTGWRSFRTKNLTNGMRIDGGRVLRHGNKWLLVSNNPSELTLYKDREKTILKYRYEGVAGYRVPTKDELEVIKNNKEMLKINWGEYWAQGGYEWRYYGSDNLIFLNTSLNWYKSKIIPVKTIGLI